MKKWTFLSGIAVSTCILFFSSCGEGRKGTGEETDTTAVEKEEEEFTKEEKVVSRTCYPLSVVNKEGKSNSTMTFTYENNQLTGIEMVSVRNGKEKKQTGTFEFTEDGKLSKFNSSTEQGDYSVEYVYNEQGKPVEITSDSKFLSPIKFECNEKGQIVKQITEYNGTPYQTNTYEYNDKGQPVSCKVTDGEGKNTHTYQFEYDDKPNPFQNLGMLANPVELLYGTAVGNVANNVVKISTTYHEKTSYKVNGEYKQAGDIDELVFSYEYNDSGYPVKRIVSTDTTTVEYRCE